MKKLLFVFCIAIAAHCLYAQHHFPKDSAEWKLAHVRSNAGQIQTGLIVYRYFGDTLIDNKNYKHFRISNSTGNHFIRIDTVQNQVVIRPDTNWALGVFPNGDNLLYDFGKTVGDTIKVLDFVMRDTVRWYVIKDSLMTIGGQQRRFIDVKTDYYFGYEDRWVEGIGSLREFFAPALEPSGFFEFAFQVVCFTDLGTNFRYEPDSLWDPSINCDANISTDPAPINKPLKVNTYPNPFQDELQIENATGAALRFSIFSPTGAKWVSGGLGPYQIALIETRQLPQGIYFIRYFSDRHSASQKLIKLSVG